MEGKGRERNELKRIKRCTVHEPAPMKNVIIKYGKYVLSKIKFEKKFYVFNQFLNCLTDAYISFFLNVHIL